MAVEGARGLRFNGNVALVTGGCSGIGKAISDVLVEHGGKVAVLDIDGDVGSSLSLDGPGEVFFILCDVSKEEDVKKAVLAAVDKFGHIDLLVNNAGRHSPPQTTDNTTAEEFRDLLNLNVMGYFLMCKYALPYIRKTKGSVVNIASIGQIGHREGVSYVTSKGAISAMTRALAIDEAKNGVRVNTISPGTMMTKLFEDWCDSLKDEREVEKIKYLHLLGRIGEPREVGLACLFLAKDATFSTGIDLSCSGGMEIGLGDKFY